MASFGSLEIAKKALMAQRFGLDVTSNNIANVNTPGYSRRSAVLHETSPRLTNGGFIGTGVVATQLRTFRQEFVDRELRSSYARRSLYEADERIFGRLEAILAEPSENGLNELTGKFFNAFQELSLKPEDTGLRQHILSLGQSLVERFHAIDSDIKDLREDMALQAETQLDQANNYIKEIARLNEEITSSKARAGKESQTLVDERERYLEELTKIAGVTVHHQEGGSVNVHINGISVVTENVPSTLQLTETVDNATNERTLSISKLDNDGNISSTVYPDSGELSSILKHFNVTLDGLDSSGGFSIQNQIDAFANAIATKVNGLTTTGYGLDDLTGPPPGRSFFSPVVGPVTAASINISADVLNNPRDIPLSDSPGEPGNNVIALQLANLAGDQNFINNTTPSQYYSGFIGKLGTLANESLNNMKTYESITSQLEVERESVIGVNLDEEAVNLIKFQRAFEASSRVANMADEVMGTIVNLGR